MSKQTDKREAIERLRKLCPPGTRIFTTLRRVARSGMSRVISLHVIDKDGDVWWLDSLVGKALGCPLVNTPQGEGLRVSGCGMDMGFHLVHSLSYVLHGDAERKGYTLEQRWL